MSCIARLTPCLSYVSALQPGGIHTQSMPDLSKPVPQDQPFPSYMPGAGSDKKKRGFLSFLKKDKSSKFKPVSTPGMADLAQYWVR